VPSQLSAKPAAVSHTSVSKRPRDLFIVANNIDELGGLQRVAHLLAGLLSERGHRVRLIGIRPFTPVHAYASPDSAYTTHVIGVAARRGRRNALGNRPQPLEQPTAQDIERLNEIFASAGDGIVICMQVHAMTWVAAAETSHLRVIGMSHESFMASVGSSRGSRVPSRFRRIGATYREIDAFLLLTRADADQFRRVGFNNTGVMPNPVALRPSRPAELATQTIITVGRLAPEKNYRALVEAFAQLAPDHPDWGVKIFGDGPLRAPLQQQVDRAGLTDRVLLKGTTNDVEGELLDSSIFALSSESEGLPVVLVEAMACGVPCVAYDCSPGIREIITDGVDGVVAANRSVSDLSAGIRRLIEDVQLRRSMGRAAVVGAQRFSEDNVLGLWEDLFDTVER
jgi:glycosyltransferase involved in cell wall biosynthesis